MIKDSPSFCCFSLLATPFEEDGGLDLFAFDRVLEHQIGGAGGVAIGFPEGEGQALSVEEFRLLLQEAVLFFSGRRSVAAACYAAFTEQALLLGRTAAEAGADLLFVPPPYGTAPVSGDYFCHLKAVSSLGVPFVSVLPFSGGQYGGGDRLLLGREIVRLPHFAGFVLEGMDSPAWGLWRTAHPETPLYMKNDGLAVPALYSGFSGIFSTIGCLLPRQTALFCKECAQNSRRAAALHSALFPLCTLLGGREGTALLKWGLHKKGLCAPTLRLPRTLPSERLLAELERVLEEAERGVQRVYRH